MIKFNIGDYVYTYNGMNGLRKAKVLEICKFKDKYLPYEYLLLYENGFKAWRLESSIISENEKLIKEIIK